MLIGLFLISGIAYGSYYAFKYFKKPGLSDLIVNAIENKNQTDLYRLNYEIDLEFNSSEDNKGLSGQVNPFSGLLDEVKNNKFNIKGFDLIDYRDEENIKTEGDLVLSGAIGFGKLGLEKRILKEALYLKISEIPTLLSVFIQPDMIKNKWIKFNKDSGEGLISQYSDIFEKDKAEEDLISKEQIKEIESLLNNKNLYKEIEPCSEKTLNNVEVYNCRFQLQGQETKGLILALVQIMNPEKYQEQLDKIDDKEWDKLFKVLPNTIFDLSFAASNHSLNNAKIFFKNNENEGLFKNVAVELNIDRSIKEANIEEPADSINIEELIGSVMGSFINVSGPADNKNFESDSIDFDFTEEIQLEDGDTKKTFEEQDFENLEEIDSDGDGLSDNKEIEINTDPFYEDTDYDDLSDGEEMEIYFTDPLNLDTDGDGLSDGEEVEIYFTDPLNPDTDGDGYTDGEEVDSGYNPAGDGKL